RALTSRRSPSPPPTSPPGSRESPPTSAARATRSEPGSPTPPAGPRGEPPAAPDLPAWFAGIAAAPAPTCDAVRARLADLPREIEGEARALLAGEAAPAARAGGLQGPGAGGWVGARVRG